MPLFLGKPQEQGPGKRGLVTGISIQVMGRMGREGGQAALGINPQLASAKFTLDAVPHRAQSPQNVLLCVWRGVVSLPGPCL